ncbi:Ig-like domain-containing protein [Mycolicibacterium sp. P9-22]|uniref:Ig-like domain-containing protein n=1 Tax=Mycolicibacterium sp. P9-22 TaxID=2024613 RepID=UPI001883438D|nr:Ig-like domain-containing protein [Mycolicibacterium sp. P9-22]
MRDSTATDCARHVGRIGALAVALGIGVAIAVPAPAGADPGTGGSDTGQSDSTVSAPDAAPSDPVATTADTAETGTEPETPAASSGTASERPSLRTASPKKKPRTTLAQRRTVRTADSPVRQQAVEPSAPTVLRAVTIEPAAAPAPVIAAATVSSPVPQTIPKLTLPTPAKVINTLLSALTAPLQGSRPGPTVEFPGLWVLLAAARRQLGLTPAATAASAPAAMAVAAAITNVQPVIGAPAIGDPDPTTGAVSGHIVATDPEGARLSYAVLTRPAEGTLAFSSTGTFVYTPTASQRVLAGLTAAPDAVFTVTVSDGSTPKVTASVAIPIDPTPIHLLGPVLTGDRPGAVAVTNGRAYLVNSTTGTLTVIDTLDGTVVSTIPVGTDPVSVAVKADGKAAYVADAAGRSITVIDTATNTVKRKIALSFTPTTLAISPAGGALYIGNATGRMAKLSTSTNRIVAWISGTTGATALVVSPNGKRVYASTPAGIAAYSTSSWWSNSAKLLAGTTGSTVLAVSRDSASVYTASAGTQIKVLSATNFTVLNEFATAEPTTNAAVSKDGSLLFLTAADGDLAVYDTKTRTLQTTLDTGSGIGGLAASPDGMQLYVTDTAAGALRVISLVPANLRPEVVAPTGTGNAVTGQVIGSTGVTDGDGDPLKITVLTKPTKGTIVFGADGTFTYTPTATARHAAAADTAPLSALTETVTITVDDGRRGVVQQTITIAVVPANAAPVPKVTVGTPNSTTGVITGIVQTTDANGDRIYFDGTTATLKGTLVVAADGRFTYTPTITARHAAATTDPSARTETLTITVDDGHGGVLYVPVTLNISPRNTAPTTASISGLATDPATGRVTGLLNVTDAEQDRLTFTVPTGPSRGTVVLNADGTFGYTPTAVARAAGNGTDSFTVRVDDGHGATQTLTVSVAVVASTPGNDLPVAGTIAYAVNAVTGAVSGQIQVTDSSPLSYLLASAAPTAGTLTINPSTGAFTFTPNAVARYRAWFTPGADALNVTVSVLEGGHGIPVDISIPVAAVHPDVDGTLTLAELRNLTSTGYVDVGRNAAGKVRNIDGTFAVDTVTDAASAAALLNRISTLLGVPAGFATANEITVSTNDFGSRFYRLNPTVNGLRVLGSELVLTTDGTGTVTSLISNYDVRITGVSTVPIGPVDRASKVVDLIKADLVSDLGGNPSQATKDAFLATLHYDTELVIYHEDLNHAPQLAWRVDVTSAADSIYPSIGTRYIIAANGSEPGNIISEFSTAQHALAPVRSSGTDQLGKVRTVTAANTGSSIVLTDIGRNIATYATRYQSAWSGLPSIPGNLVGYTTSWLRSAVSAQANMARVFDYYTSVLGRDSFDDNGAPLVMSIDYNPGGVSASGWRNAAWTGSVMVFGDAGITQAALDLVAHEYTHAVIQYINGLAYLGESGAMNESYADIMGAIIENKTGTGRWLFAEDAAGDPYRNMEDPSDYRQPEHYGGRYVDACGCNANDDFDYVHSNSGIMNFAAYKMMEASKNQVSGEQWARVFYDSLYRLPSTAKFVDARYAIISSARSEGFSAAQIDAIKAAFDSVGVVADKLP